MTGEMWKDRAYRERGGRRSIRRRISSGSAAISGGQAPRLLSRGLGAGPPVYWHTGGGDLHI